MKKLILLMLSMNVLFAVAIDLVSGEGVSDSVAKNEMKQYKIHAEAGQSVDTLMNDLTADGDLYVKIGSEPTTNSFDCRSIHTALHSEDCSVTLQNSDDVYIGIWGYQATDYTIKATTGGVNNGVVTLTSGEGVTGSVAQGETKHYKLTASNGDTVKSVISDLEADADLYVKIGSKATAADFDCKSTHGGLTEDECSVFLNANAEVFVAVYGYKATNFKVTATKSAGGQDNVTELISGVGVSGNVEEGVINYYKIAGQDGETVESLLDNLNADSDLFVKVGSKPTRGSFDCKSTHGGNTDDSCSVVLNADSEVFIGVYGYRATNYQITATLKAGNDDGTLLTSDEPQSGSVARDSMDYYRIPAELGDTVIATLEGLNADADLYVKVGSKPTTSENDCKSTHGGTTNELCSLDIFDTTDVYIGVFGFRATDYTVKAKIEREPVPANPTILEDAEGGALNPNWVTARGNQPPFICTVQGRTMMANHASHQGDAPYRYELPVNNRTQRVLSMDIGGGSSCNIGYGRGYMPHYSVGVIVETRLGVRSMEWNSWYTHQGYGPRKSDNGHNVFLKYPSPVEMVRGWQYAYVSTWTHLEVNLDIELHRLEPDNEIYKVIEFFATGGFLDNITLSSAN